MFIHLKLYKLVIQENCCLNYCYCKLFYEHKVVTCILIITLQRNFIQHLYLDPIVSRK